MTLICVVPKLRPDLTGFILHSCWIAPCKTCPFEWIRMTRKPLVSPRVAAEIKALEQAIEDAREELRRLNGLEIIQRSQLVTFATGRRQLVRGRVVKR